MNDLVILACFGIFGMTVLLTILTFCAYRIERRRSDAFDRRLAQWKKELRKNGTTD